MLSNVFTRKDIRQLDFVALCKAGYRGAVFDKDNCLVGIAHVDVENEYVHTLIHRQHPSVIQLFPNLR
jgi:predicted HAD superfamily phosphohydrolase YqeG